MTQELISNIIPNYKEWKETSDAYVMYDKNDKEILSIEKSEVREMKPFQILLYAFGKIQLLK